MSPSVQPIPLGKDFLSSQWSKTLLVGCLHCVLGEAFADCEQMKQIEKVLDFPSPTKTLSLEHLLYHLCASYLSHRNADSTVSVRSITYIASSQCTEFSHSSFRDSSLKKYVFGKRILQQSKGNPCIFLSFPSTSSSWKETETGIIKTSKSWVLQKQSCKMPHVSD